MTLSRIKPGLTIIGFGTGSSKMDKTDGIVPKLRNRFQKRIKNMLPS